MVKFRENFNFCYSAIPLFRYSEFCYSVFSVLAAGSAKYKKCVDNLATRPAMYIGCTHCWVT